MGLFDQLSANPYMSSSRGLANPRTDLLASVRYQIVPSLRALPMAQIELDFRRDIPTVSNPDMTLTVLLDRSGSMSEAFREGHVFDVASAIFNHAFYAGVGYDLVFFDDRVSYAGHMRTTNDVYAAIQNNGPRGGTYVTEALRGAIQELPFAQGHVYHRHHRWRVCRQNPGRSSLFLRIFCPKSRRKTRTPSASISSARARG